MYIHVVTVQITALCTFLSAIAAADDVESPELNCSSISFHDVIPEYFMINPENVGAFLAGFTFAMIFGGLSLLFSRREHAITGHRWSGVVLPLFIYLFDGLNPGALAATLLCLLWAIKLERNSTTK